jgi:hypothetical protein
VWRYIFVTSCECACRRADQATWVATARFTLGVTGNAQPKPGIPIGGNVEIRLPGLYTRSQGRNRKNISICPNY